MSNKVNKKCAKKIKEASGDWFLRLLPVYKLSITTVNVERRPISGKLVDIDVMVVTVFSALVSALGSRDIHSFRL